MPQVLEDIAAATGGRFELVGVENTLFGPSVTTAGLLPGAAIEAALRERRDLDFALVPAEAVNDDSVFVDGVGAGELADRLPMPVRLSYDFADVLSECGMRSAECGIGGRGRSNHDAHLDIPHSAFRTPHSGVGEGQR